MAGPFAVELDLEGFAFGWHVDFLPPQRSITGLNHQVAGTGCRWRDGNVGRGTIGVGRFVQGELDLIRAHRTAVGVVLGTVAGPEALAGNQASGRVFNLDAVRAPFNLEVQARGGACLDVDRFFTLGQEFLVEVVAPAVTLRVVPVVVTALANQAHLEVVDPKFVALAVGDQHLKLHRTITVSFFTVEQATQPRQAFGGPDRLFQTPGNRPATGLLQASLHRQLQRRTGFRPFAFNAKNGVAVDVQIDFIELQVLTQLLFSDRTELITRQCRYRFAQWTHIGLTAQTIARRRSAIQIAAIDVDFGILFRTERYIAAFELQGQALGQEIFDEKFVDLFLTATQVEQQLPATGGCFGRQLQLILVQTIAAWLPNKLAADLFIGPTHFHGHWLGFERATILITQQAIEQHRFAGTVEITRAKHKKLQGVGLGSGDIELCQVQCRTVQAQHGGVHTLFGQQGLSLGRHWQLGMTIAVGFALPQHTTFCVKQLKVDAAQCLATFQPLGEHVDTVLEAVRRHANVAEGEQGRWLRVVVGARGSHHRQVHAWLLQRLDAGDRQQHGFAGVARRVEVETAAVDQLGHVQGFFGLVVVETAVTAPGTEERRERFRLDAEELNIDLIDVQGDHRQAFGQTRRQQRTPACKADGRLHVAGFQAADRLSGQAFAVNRLQTCINGQHQLALRLQVTQAQLHTVVRKLPGTIDLAFDGIDQVYSIGKVLLRIQRHRKAQGQGTGPIDLNFGDIHHTQLTASVALGQGRGILDWFCRGGGLLYLGLTLGGCLGRRRGRLIRGRRVASTEQGQRAGQQQSFVEHESNSLAAGSEG
ncbi:hypothetical protein D3C80_656340 [compost metagenome]